MFGDNILKLGANMNYLVRYIVGNMFYSKRRNSIKKQGCLFLNVVELIVWYNEQKESKLLLIKKQVAVSHNPNLNCVLNPMY